MLAMSSFHHNVQQINRRVGQWLELGDWRQGPHTMTVAVVSKHAQEGACQHEVTHWQVGGLE
jgi:hypothetical protein